MPRPQVTRMAEDYLTVVWKAYEWPGSRPKTTDIAEQLGVTPSTVSANLRRLARDELLSYEPYGPIELTPSGEAVALDLVRRHRLVETYLVERLGLGWDEVHREADLLEHAVSDLVLERMDAALGHPATDPHGDAIPRPGDRVHPRDAAPLSARVAGDRVRVLRVSDRQPEILRHLQAKAVLPGAELEVLDPPDASGTMRVRRDGHDVEISTPGAEAVWVADA